MPHRGRTTAILLATGAVVVVVLGVSNFWGDIVWFFQSDAERIQGKWRVVSNDGAESIAFFVFEGSTLTMTNPFAGTNFRITAEPDSAVLEKWSYRLDEQHRPGWFDMTGFLPMRGIYELSGDTLRICVNMGEQRSTAFDSKPGRPHLLWVLQRE
jgi:uncharacterized protein (TIGR03067 family)